MREIDQLSLERFVHFLVVFPESLKEIHHSKRIWVVLDINGELGDVYTYVAS